MRSSTLLTLLAVCALAQSVPPGVQKKSSIGGITEYEYPNGLRVLLYPNPANPKITINVTYLVGSRHEGYGETGMAHLLEHMNFIETTNGRQIKNEIVGRGAAWNGTTSYDRTNYYETVPASDENLKWALGLEADRMVRVKFTKQILDTEVTVVLQRVRARRKQPAKHPARARRGDGVSLAQLRQVNNRVEGRPGEGPGGPPGGVLQEVLPARQCRAGADRAAGRGEDPASGRRYH